MKSNDILHADYLDLIFDSRNKEYGAYMLRRNYSETVKKALLLFGLLLTLSIWWLTRPKIVLIKPPVAVKLSMENVKIKEMKLPELAPPANRHSAAASSWRVSKENTAKPNTDPGQQPEAGDETTAGVISGIHNGPVMIDPSAEPPHFGETIQTPSPVIPPDDNKVFDIVQQYPEFEGGEKALLIWLSKQIKYPAIARESGLEGKVFISFIIEKDGSVANVKIVMDGVGGGCAQAAKDAVSRMPAWKPGKQQGKAVRVKVTLPIAFKLD